jgi:hypothetical protein
VLLGIGLSCSKEATNSDQPKVSNTVNWTNLLEENRALVLTGGWLRAESAYNKLVKVTYSDDELKSWLDFQIQIIEKTAQDREKGTLSRSAIQQFGFYPAAAKPYENWLRDGLRTNRFSDPFVAQQAREALSRIESRDRKP